MNIENYDVSSDPVEKFISNHNKNNKFPLRNLYIFKSIDKDGNIKDTKFGVNLITRTGFDVVPIEGSNYSLYIGDGSGTPSYEDTALFHYLGNVSDPDTSTTNYLLYYDSDKNLICQYRKIDTFTMDYTFLNTSFNITEFGLYYTSLRTHGLILDSSGQPSHITKTLYDKLIVEIRWLYVVSPEVQHRLISSGIYGILQPNWRYVNQQVYCHLFSDSYFPYDSYSHSSDELSTTGYLYNTTVSKNAQMKRCGNFLRTPRILCERNYEYISNFQVSSNRKSLDSSTNILLSMPIYGDREELVCDYAFSDSGTNEVYFKHLFQSIIRGGYNSYYGYGIFPVSNFKIESCYMYNCEDHLWNISENFLSCENSEFNDFSLMYGAYVWMKNPDGISKRVYIYTNNNIDIPIIKFNISGVVLYATDEWWDNTTWILITNMNQLTPSQSNKRYYICETQTSLNPVRDQQFPKIICNKRQYNWDIEHIYDNNESVSPLVVSDQYEMYCTPNFMFFHPEGLPGGYDQTTPCVQKDLRFTWPQSIVGDVSTKDVSTAYRHCFDDKVVICSSWYYSYAYKDITTSGTHIRILDISDSSINMDPTAETPYVDLQLDFTNKTRKYAGQQISHNWDGDFWISYEPNAKEIVAVKIHGGVNQDTPEQVLVDSGIISYTFDYGNDHLIYTKDGMTFYHYNLGTHVIDDTIDIMSFDSSVTEIKNYIGYNGIIYITAKYSAGDWYTYFYNTITQTWKVDKTVWCNSIERDGMCGYNNKCAIISPKNSKSPELVIINSQDPYNFIKSTNDNFKHIYPNTCHLTYVNNGKQLVFSFRSTSDSDNESYRQSYYNVLDIGLILDTGEFYNIYQHEQKYWAYQTKLQQSCIYKDDIIFRGRFTGASGANNSCINILPIEKFICHKMTISTNSLTGYNNPFSLEETEMFQILHSTTMDRLLIDPVDPQSCCYCTIYRIDMYESTTLAHRFVPCVRDADSVPGLYDTVTNEFLEPLDPLSMIPDTSTAITTDYNLPSGYTQVYSIAHTSGDANWFTTANMTTPIIHTQHTKIEWYGMIPTPPTGTSISMCLFGSQEYDNENEYHFEFWSARNGGFGYRRGTSTIETNTGTYNTDIKIVCDGLTASWYDITGTTLIDSITCTGTLDDGKTPFAFLTRGLPNGYDYNPQP